MKKAILLFFLCCVSLVRAQTSDSIPPKNQQIIDTVLRYGKSISPTYQEAVCTEFVIGVLKHFIPLSKQDIVNININQPRKSIEDVYQQMENGSPYPKGVVHALTSNGKGEAITNLADVRAGDFVQFWYYRSWGHCGIVEHIDIENKVLYLYSSFPSTDGYGIQPFDMPEYCYFVRLK